MANWDYSSIVELFSKEGLNDQLLEGKWGLEKESLRITPNGDLALTPHPKAFGDKIKNQHITVDFSESQVELITPAFTTIEETHRFLSDLHTRAANSLDNELFWPLSMPGTLPPDESIPIASYNDSPEGKEKEIYRSGLALRYGKRMQMISGIHYNYSFGRSFLNTLYDRFGETLSNRQFTDVVYLNLVKNFLGYRWLMIYLFGASPLGTDDYMSTFLKRNALMCDKAGCRITFKDPVKHAVSLRMSRFGYENGFQNQLNVSYNSLNSYISRLREALSTKVDAYGELGIHQQGKQVQLNDNLLQIENEYYAPVRFKQQADKGQIMLDALEQKGIDYIEIRTFDLDPYEAPGISLNQLYFTHVFLLFCTFEGCCELTQKDMDRFNDNAQLAALYGRNEKLKLHTHTNKKTTIQNWGEELFARFFEIADMLDEAGGKGVYTTSVEAQYSKLRDLSQLPSAHIIAEIDTADQNHETFGLKKAKEHIKPQPVNAMMAS